jgi:RHS repeat-associated protein
MVEIGSGSTWKQFVFQPDGSLLAVMNSTTGLVKGTIPLPGGSSAIYDASGLSYIRHTDWLGSSRLSTTWNHAVYSKEAYAPFGETYNEAGTPDRSFTGQDQDVVTGSPASGVYDFLFRKYDPSAGRWLSPDPAGWNVVDQTDPQSLDRYAYVENQPLNLVDADGLAPPCPVSSDGVTPIGPCSNPGNPPPPAPSTGTKIKVWAAYLAALAYVSEVPTCSSLASQSQTTGRFAGAGGVYSLVAALTGVGLPAAAPVGTASAVVGAGAFFGDIASWLHIGCRQ